MNSTDEDSQPAGEDLAASMQTTGDPADLSHVPQKPSSEASPGGKQPLLFRKALPTHQKAASPKKFKGIPVGKKAGVLPSQVPKKMPLKLTTAKSGKFLFSAKAMLTAAEKLTEPSSSHEESPAEFPPSPVPASLVEPKLPSPKIVFDTSQEAPADAPSPSTGPPSPYHPAEENFSGPPAGESDRERKNTISSSEVEQGVGEMCLPPPAPVVIAPQNVAEPVLKEECASPTPAGRSDLSEFLLGHAPKLSVGSCPSRQSSGPSIGSSADRSATKAEFEAGEESNSGSSSEVEAGSELVDLDEEGASSSETMPTITVVSSEEPAGGPDRVPEKRGDSTEGFSATGGTVESPGTSELAALVASETARSVTTCEAAVPVQEESVEAAPGVPCEDSPEGVALLASEEARGPEVALASEEARGPEVALASKEARGPELASEEALKEPEVAAAIGEALREPELAGAIERTEEEESLTIPSIEVSAAVDTEQPVATVGAAREPVNRPVAADKPVVIMIGPSTGSERKEALCQSYSAGDPPRGEREVVVLLDGRSGSTALEQVGAFTDLISPSSRRNTGAVSPSSGAGRGISSDSDEESGGMGKARAHLKGREILEEFERGSFPSSRSLRSEPSSPLSPTGGVRLAQNGAAEEELLTESDGDDSNANLQTQLDQSDEAEEGGLPSGRSPADGGQELLEQVNENLSSEGEDDRQAVARITKVAATEQDNQTPESEEAEADDDVSTDRKGDSDSFSGESTTAETCVAIVIELNGPTGRTTVLAEDEVPALAEAPGAPATESASSVTAESSEDDTDVYIIQDASSQNRLIEHDEVRMLSLQDVENLTSTHRASQFRALPEMLLRQSLEEPEDMESAAAMTLPHSQPVQYSNSLATTASRVLPTLVAYQPVSFSDKFGFQHHLSSEVTSSTATLSPTKSFYYGDSSPLQHFTRDRHFSRDQHPVGGQQNAQQPQDQRFVRDSLERPLTTSLDTQRIHRIDPVLAPRGIPANLDSDPAPGPRGGALVHHDSAPIHHISDLAPGSHGFSVQHESPPAPVFRHSVSIPAVLRPPLSPGPPQQVADKEPSARIGSLPPPSRTGFPSAWNSPRPSPIQLVRSPHRLPPHASQPSVHIEQPLLSPVTRRTTHPLVDMTTPPLHQHPMLQYHPPTHTDLGSFIPQPTPIRQAPSYALGAPSGPHTARLPLGAPGLPAIQNHPAALRSRMLPSGRPTKPSPLGPLASMKPRIWPQMSTREPKHGKIPDAPKRPQETGRHNHPLAEVEKTLSRHGSTATSRHLRRRGKLPTHPLNRNRQKKAASEMNCLCCQVVY